MPKRFVILTVIWSIAFLVALALDYPVAHWVHVSGLGRAVEGKAWAQVIKEPGEFRFTLIIALLLWITRRIQPRQAIFLMLAGVVSGANSLVKWIVGRTRPYKLPGSADLHPFVLHPFWHGFHGLFVQRDLCFPSGHECTAAALATGVFLVWPRCAWVFLLLAVLVGIERPAENAHYVSDVIGAGGFGILGTVLLHRALKGWLEPARKFGPS